MPLFEKGNGKVPVFGLTWNQIPISDAKNEYSNIAFNIRSHPYFGMILNYTNRKCLPVGIRRASLKCFWIKPFYLIRTEMNRLSCISVCYLQTIIAILGNKLHLGLFRTVYVYTFKANVSINVCSVIKWLPFPPIDAFWLICSRRLLKTL